MRSRRKSKRRKPESNLKQHKCLAYNADGNHAYFYDSELAKRSISHLAVANNNVGAGNQSFANDFETKKPPSD